MRCGRLGVEVLEAVGVTEFDEQVYRGLLRQPAISATELAKSMAQTPARTRHSLWRLESLGLARRVDPRLWEPVAPRTGLAALLQQRQAKLQTESDALDAAADELSQDYLVGELQRQPSGLIEVITGADQIYRTALDFWHTATDEILIFDKPPYAAEQAEADYDEVDNERPLLERGVRVRGIYQRSVLETAGYMKVAARLAELGEQARVLPELPIKLHIYDRRVAMVPLTGDTHAGQSRAIVHPSGLLSALIALFEAYWERAHPLFGSAAIVSADPDGHLSGEEDAVLRMLAAGMKDQAIARQLGVSRRTAARRTERILEVLDASSRFQAGAQAARRGWI